MLETLAGSNEDIAEGLFAFEETVERGTSAIISPGARYAFNLPNDAQLVIGAALPIGLTSDSPDWGLFFYCSFEHAFLRAESRLTKYQDGQRREAGLLVSDGKYLLYRECAY